MYSVPAPGDPTGPATHSGWPSAPDSLRHPVSPCTYTCVTKNGNLERIIRLAKEAKVLTQLTHVNSWDPVVSDTLVKTTCCFAYRIYPFKPSFSVVHVHGAGNSGRQGGEAFRVQRRGRLIAWGHLVKLAFVAKVVGGERTGLTWTGDAVGGDVTWDGGGVVGGNTT